MSIGQASATLPGTGDVGVRVPTGNRPAFLGRRWVYELGYAVLVLGAASLILSLVGRSAGWPIGSSFTEQLIYVQLYAAHFRHLDFFPVWSTSDGFGLGTPALLFYHKTFFYVAGLILILLGGDLKATLIATIAIFLVVGAYGMRLALQMVTQSRLLQFVGSVGFLFTNYVFTDWLTRGDLPEFSAMMIVPWLLYWCLNLVRYRRVSLLLIVIVPLLVDGHSAIGLLAIFTLLIAMITFVARFGTEGLRAITPRLIVAVAGATVLLVPTLLADLRFTNYYDPAVKVTHYDEVSTNFRSFGSYFYDGSFRWLAGTHELVQIDFAIWIPIAVALIAAATFWAVSGTRPDRTSWGRRFDMPCILMLLACLVVYLALQLRAFYWVYEVLTPLQAIDFPSRMLAFITPIGVILVISLANAAMLSNPSSSGPRLIALAWMISLIVLSPLTSTWTANYGLLASPGHFPSMGDSAVPRYVDFQKFTGLFTLNGILFQEYLPKVYGAQGRELYDDTHLYQALHSHDHGAQSLSDVPCSVAVPTRVPLESLSLTFKVRCQGPTRLALPVTFNAYSSVFLESRGETLRQIPYHHSQSDPRMIIDVPSSKSAVVVVHLPTLWSVLK